MKLAQIGTFAAALMALSAQWAHAAPALALATKNVNIRQGPGTTYPVITTIPNGSTVEVSNCQGEWCSVVWQGQQGFAIASSFDQGRGAPPRGAGGPPPGATAQGPPGAPPPGYPPGAPPPGYPQGYPPPGYAGYYYPPGYNPYYAYGPGYYGDPYYGPYWRRRGW